MFNEQINVWKLIWFFLFKTPRYFALVSQENLTNTMYKDTQYCGHFGKDLHLWLESFSLTLREHPLFLSLLWGEGSMLTLRLGRKKNWVKLLILGQKWVLIVRPNWEWDLLEESENCEWYLNKRWLLLQLYILAELYTHLAVLPREYSFVIEIQFKTFLPCYLPELMSFHCQSSLITSIH